MADFVDNKQPTNNLTTKLTQIVGDDPWAHRSKHMRCVSCMWFAERLSNKVQDATHFIGRCRRHAPTMTGYPVVYSDDWCGDHKMNENAG